jgi:hypothetical protein
LPPKDLQFILQFSTIFLSKIASSSKSTVSLVLRSQELVHSASEAFKRFTDLLLDVIGQIVQIKVASLKQFDLQVELIDDLLLFSDIET